MKQHGSLPVRSKLEPWVGFSAMGLMLVAVLSLLPLGGVADALQGPTATVAPLGDLIIPTATPAQGGGGGGLLIPTATPAQGGGGGGFVIPTATPGSVQTGPALPPLSTDQLTVLNLQPGDVPGDFAANQQVETFDQQSISSQLRSGGYADMADLYDQIAATYGWTQSVGVTYTSCQPTVPISEIYSEVAQLASPDAGRAFFADPQVQQLLTAFGYTLQPAGTVFGYRGTLGPSDGACFAQETEYELFFEYWGMFVIISMKADANTDPALVNGLLDQIAPTMIAKIDAMAPQAFPATPVPPTVTVVAGGPVVTPPEPTTAPIQPLPTQPAANTVALSDLEKLMPSLTDLQLPSPPFALNQQLTGTFSAEQLVANLNGLGLTELANATQQAAQRDGLQGMVGYVWDTGTQCPDTVGLSLEVDLYAFDTAQGAVNNLNDAATQQAWINTGVIQTFQAQGNGVLSSGSFAHRCGTVTIQNLQVPVGRFVVTVSGIGNVGSSPQDILAAITQLNAFMVQQIQQSGLQ